MAYITNCVVWNWYYNATSSASFLQPYAIYKNNVIGGYYPGSTSFNASSFSEFYNNLFINVSNVSSESYNILVNFPSGCVNSGNISRKNWSAYYASEDSVMTYPAASMKTTVAGQDGTPIGITGGTGFSEWPSIPRITSKTIDSSTDADGKINVKIAVKVEQ